MKNLLSFPSARKVAAVLVAVLRALENTLTAAVKSTTTTFTWTGGPFTPAQPGVTVRIDSISDLVTVYPDVTKGDYQITLVEVDARTT